MHVRIGKQKRENKKQSAYTYAGAIQTPGATRLHASNTWTIWTRQLANKKQLVVR